MDPVAATPFATTIRDLLAEGSTLQALSLFTDNKNQAEVRENCWDLVPIIAAHLTEDSENENIEVFKCCEKLIDIVAEESKPEDALLQFIEQIEEATDDTKFLMMVKPLQKVLVRVPNKRVTSLAWCFNSIQCYLGKLETPEDFNLTDEEKLLLDANSLVSRITFVYSELLQLCQMLVSELTEDNKTEDRVNVIRKSLVQLLGKPFAFLDLEICKGTKPKARKLAEDLIAKISVVTPDPFIFLELRENTHNSELKKPSDLSLGVFYYLVLSEQICLSRCPKVYSSVYVFHNSLRLVNNLLREEHQFVTKKALCLASTLLSSVNVLQLPHWLLDSKEHSEFCRILSHIAVFNECVEMRKFALKILQNYLWAFNHQGRYCVSYHLMECVDHSGLKGNVITQYKDMLRHEMITKAPNKMSKYYTGRKLFDLLEKFTFLKEKEQSDLVDKSDQIVSTLNFLRYLLIADNTGNCTGIDSFMPCLEEGYFSYLAKGIEMAKAHYEQKVRELPQEGAKDKVDIGVTVSGKHLMEMSLEQKIEIMKMSLTTLDVIESLFNRVLGCIEERKFKKF